MFQGILDLHVYTGVTQKILYLNLPGQWRDDLTESFTKGDSHLDGRNNLFKGMRKGESMTYILVVLLDHEV